MNNLKIISSLKWKIVLWILLFTMIYLAFSYGKQYGINERIIILVTLILGVFTQIFTGITSLIAIIPFFGPFILKVISIPIFYFLNALGWVVSAIAIKKGYVNELSRSRTIKFPLLVVIIIGYIFSSKIILSSHDLFLGFIAGFFQVGLGFIFITIGAKTTPSALVGIIMLIEAILGPLWAWLFINETPPLVVLVGGTIVLLAVVLQFFNRKIVK